VRYVEELFDKHIAFVDKRSGLVLFDIRKFIENFSAELEIDDLLRGKVQFKLEELVRSGTKFFPLVRSDKSALYHLASVIDDATFGVTHIVRGQDKASAAEFQEMVRTSLGFEPVKYLHTPMMLGHEGQLLHGDVAFEDFLKKGIIPHSLISYMISSGYGDPNETYLSLSDFIASFDYRKIHKNNGKFDEMKLQHVNKLLLNRISCDVLTDSIRIYLKVVDDDRLLKEFDESAVVRDFIIKLRREPAEARQIMQGLLHPVYAKLPESLKDMASSLLQDLIEHPGVLPALQPGQDIKKYYDALRIILVGKISFPDATETFNCLVDSGRIEARLRLAQLQLFGPSA
jgi:glutamyl/glutaminyl-tRNA synthetase